MKADSPSALQREGLELFGSFCAGLSHEISNVFNIINELAGLERDIARDAAERGGDAAVGRIADLAERIKAQVARGEEMNRLLHRLGHSIDSSSTAFDLGELLTLVGALEARAARLARVELEVRPPETPVTLEGDPFALLLALDACVGRALAAARDGRRIEVGCEHGTEAILIVVESADPMTDGEGILETAPLRLGAAVWQASVTVQPDAAPPRRVVIALPHAGSSSSPGSDRSSQEES